MSIQIEYHGRIGNVLFQYIFARILGEKNGFYLKTEFPYQQLLKTTALPKGKVFDSPVRVIEDMPPYNQQYINEYRLYECFNEPLSEAAYLLRGHFENSDFYNMNESLIKSFFVLDSPKINTKDIVINIRLGKDFSKWGIIIHPEWYLKILKQETFEKVYVVGAAPDEPCLEYFKEYDPIIVPTDPLTDFHFIRKFDKIICSNSTYCWWAAFLSEAKRIYVSNLWTSPFLKSCKNSILVKGEFYRGYQAKTQYVPIDSS